MPTTIPIPMSWGRALLAMGLAVAVAGSGCGGGSSNQSCGTESGTGCAPEGQRVDLYTPTFSNPTTVNNPLNPISALHSAVFSGTVDGLPFRSETTLLPSTRTIAWNGKQIPTLEFQYMAFSDGRLQEIATDWFAQSDDGAVWYFGEDVADYDADGVVFTNEGTWLVGRDSAPLAMIMGSAPRVDDVWRAENIAPLAWEEITVKQVGVTLDGPSGPVTGAVIASELHMDGTRQEKIFAPGYGEFSTGSLATDDLEALALAIPADALSAALPSDLQLLASKTAEVFAAAEAGDFGTANAALASVSSTWDHYQAGQVPPLLKNEMVRLLARLETAVDAHQSVDSRHQAIALTRVVYDLRLRHQPPAEIDQARFDLWLAQVLVDAAAGDHGSIRGDAATMGFLLDRFRHVLDASKLAEIVGKLGALRSAADANDSEQAVTLARQLRGMMSGRGWN